MEALDFTMSSPLLTSVSLTLMKIVKEILWFLVVGVHLYHLALFPALTLFPGLSKLGLPWSLAAVPWQIATTAQDVELCRRVSSLCPSFLRWMLHFIHNTAATSTSYS